MLLGRGAFSKVVEQGNEAVKIIDADDQRPPHNWRAEVAALQALAKCRQVIDLLGVSESTSGFDHEVKLRMPKYDSTLEHVIFRHSKAKWPPNSGWRNAMAPQTVARIMHGIAAALAAAAEHGIIHRDLKPENVLFNNDDISSLVVIDFGIAFVPTVKSSFETAEEKVCDVGTGEYKSPETLFGLHYDSKVDIWALGCIGARLLSSDSVALFTPYTSDLGLISAQFEVLGRPQISDCPSLAGTRMLGEETTGTLKLDRMPSDATMQRLFALTKRMLDYESTRRPSAKELVSELEAIIE